MRKSYKFSLFITVLLSVNAAESQSTFTGVIKYQREYSNPAIPKDSMKVIFDNYRVRVSFYQYDSVLKDTKEDIFIWDFKFNKLYSIDKYLRTYSVGPYEFGNPFVFKKDSAKCIYDTILCAKYIDKRKVLENSSVRKIECEVSNAHRNINVKDLIFVSVQPLIIQSKIVLEFRSYMKDGQSSRTFATEVAEMKNVTEYFSLSNLKKTKL